VIDFLFFFCFVFGVGGVLLSDFFFVCSVVGDFHCPLHRTSHSIPPPALPCSFTSSPALPSLYIHNLNINSIFRFAACILHHAFQHQPSALMISLRVPGCVSWVGYRSQHTSTNTPMRVALSLMIIPGFWRGGYTSDSRTISHPSINRCFSILEVESESAAARSPFVQGLLVQNNCAVQG
jgi:hypothetical protein